MHGLVSLVLYLLKYHVSNNSGILERALNWESKSLNSSSNSITYYSSDIEHFSLIYFRVCFFFYCKMGITVLFLSILQVVLSHVDMVEDMKDFVTTGPTNWRDFSPVELGWEEEVSENLLLEGSFHVWVIFCRSWIFVDNRRSSNYSLSETALPAHPMITVLLPL